MSGGGEFSIFNGYLKHRKSVIELFLLEWPRISDVHTGVLNIVILGPGNGFCGYYPLVKLAFNPAFLSVNGTYPSGFS